MEERRVLGPREVRAAEVQEKMGGVPRSQAQGTEQVRFLGRPHYRKPGKGKWGLWVRAGEKGRPGIRRERKDQSVSVSLSLPPSPLCLPPLPPLLGDSHGQCMLAAGTMTSRYCFVRSTIGYMGCISQAKLCYSNK